MRIIILAALCCLFSVPVLAQRPKPQPDLDARIAKLEKDLQTLRQRVNTLQIESEKYDTAEFDLAELHKYQRINTSNGIFLISVENVERYLNGYKIKLHIGNVTSATFGGFDLSAKWGTKEPEINGGVAKWGEWYDSLKTKEEKFTQSLLPGIWNNVELILLPATPAELGYLRLSMDTNSILMREQ
jgi:hypothetical protein